MGCSGALDCCAAHAAPKSSKPAKEATSAKRTLIFCSDASRPLLTDCEKRKLGAKLRERCSRWHSCTRSAPLISDPEGPSEQDCQGGPLEQRGARFRDDAIGYADSGIVRGIHQSIGTLRQEP